MRHFLEVDDLTADELADVLAMARATNPPMVLSGLGAALLFEKPSARTRHSMEMAVVQLGGHPMTVRGDEVGLDVRESVEDVTRTLACYHSLVGARVFDHGVLERMAALDCVPVVNLLSDRGHPMQALADLITLQGEFGSLSGLRVAWVGDANNVLLSFALAAGLTGMSVVAACPVGYRFSDAEMERIEGSGCDFTVVDEPAIAARDADAIYTDVWTSMGQEDERAERLKAFAGYQIDEALTEQLAEGGIVLHCLPAHRGEEIAAGVVDGDRSRVWAQAENRMHAARGLVAWLLSVANLGADSPDGRRAGVERGAS